VSQHLIGQEQLVRETVSCLLAGGNLLIEGVPGLGKTRLLLNFKAVSEGVTAEAIIEDLLEKVKK